MVNIFNEELVRLNNERSELVESQLSLANDLSKEIEVVKQKYANLGKKVQDKLDSKNGEIDDLCESIAINSWFDKEFAHLLVDLMVTFEGRKYMYQKAEYKYTDRVSLAKDMIGHDLVQYLDIIVLEDEIQDFYSDEGIDSLDNLVKNGKVLILDSKSASCVPSDFCFYAVDFQKHVLVPKVNLDNFAYVREFVNRVIEYRINSKSKEISARKMDELEVQFLRDKEDVIKANYNARENEDRSILEKRSQERKTRLNRALTIQNN